MKKFFWESVVLCLTLAFTFALTSCEESMVYEMPSTYTAVEWYKANGTTPFAAENGSVLYINSDMNLVYHRDSDGIEKIIPTGVDLMVQPDPGIAKWHSNGVLMQAAINQEGILGIIAYDAQTGEMSILQPEK